MGFWLLGRENVKMDRLNLGLLDSVLLSIDSSLPGWAELGQAKWVGGLGGT